MKKKRLTISHTIIHIVFILSVLACLLPLALIVIISFTSESALLVDGYRFFPSAWSTGAYQYVFSGATSVVNAYGVTILVTVVGTGFHVFICALLSYALTRPEVTYRRRISLFVYIPVLFNGGMVPYYMMVTKVLRLKNTIWVLILANIVSAVNVLIMKNYFATIPNELIESARIDGSGEFRTFFQIVLPLATPSLATIGLFVAIAYWNDWMTCSLFIENNKLYTLQYLLQSLMNNIKHLQANAARSQSIMKQLGSLPSESARMATCVLSIGPIILLYPVLQKYFKKGLTVGAVKG